MLAHPNILFPNGAPVPFYLQSTIDHILWLRAEIARSRAIRAGILAETKQ
jgi:hypothetical protein